MLLGKHQQLTGMIIPFQQQIFYSSNNIFFHGVAMSSQRLKIKISQICTVLSKWSNKSSANSADDNMCYNIRNTSGYSSQLMASLDNSN